MGSRDPDYLAWLRGQPCACQPCASSAEAHHSTVAPTHAPDERAPKQLGGRRGKGQKSADWYAFSLCPKHHGQLHRLSGYFASYSGDDLEQWQNEQSARYRSLYDAQQTVPAGLPAKPPPKSAGLIDEVRQLCAHYGLPRQVELDFTRLVRRAAEEGSTRRRRLAGGR